MINVNELRIGNLVKIKTSNDANFYPIHAIDGMGLKVILGGVRQCEGWKEEKLLKPIPLTEELLLKCGMNECDDDAVVRYVYRHDKFKMNIIIPSLKEYIIRIYNLESGEQICGKDMHYLHQLQNIYFDLTGKELEL